MHQAHIYSRTVRELDYLLPMCTRPFHCQEHDRTNTGGVIVPYWNRTQVLDRTIASRRWPTQLPDLCTGLAEDILHSIYIGAVICNTRVFFVNLALASDELTGLATTTAGCGCEVAFAFTCSALELQ